MRSLIILSLILACTITNAQDRKDTIRMKDGSEIKCQILKVSEPDSVIQFCIREYGELTVKKVQTTFVDSYFWAGKENAVKYSKMLGVKTVQDGEIYKRYWAIKPPAPKMELTISEMAAKELNRASTLVKASFVVISAGLVTVIFIPKLVKKPILQSGNINSYPERVKTYNNNVKALQIAGSGIILAGTITGLSSLAHFKKANLLSPESGKGLSISTGRDGLSMAFNF